MAERFKASLDVATPLSQWSLGCPFCWAPAVSPYLAVPSNLGQLWEFGHFTVLPAGHHDARAGLPSLKGFGESWRLPQYRCWRGGSMYIEPLPTWLSKLSHQLVENGWFTKLPDQAIVNEYLPGQGIASHIDCIPCFGPTVASVSLLSNVVMDFKNPHTSETRHQLLEAGSVVVIGDEARRKWQHGIPPRKNDKWDGDTWKRKRRLSITFRIIIESPK